MTAVHEQYGAGAGATATPVLEVDGLTSSYGNLVALEDASLRIGEGEAVGIIGHNGAGKTTLLNTVFGLHSPDRGSIVYRGAPAAKADPQDSIKRGMAMVPADQFVFATLSVRENLQIARSNADSADAEWAVERGKELFPVVWERLNQAAGSLSGGERRMLSVAMALMWRPKLILLDEPSLGLAPALAERVFDALRELSDTSGLSVLCVEQSVPHLLRLVNRVYVMRSGRIVDEKSADELLQRDEYWDLF
jgi:branched-chain amino acid transport system ATP-binding protein